MLKKLIAVSLIALPLTSGLALAEPHGEWGHGDIHRFHEHDIHVWRGGGWHHEVHEGRLGWWWVVGGLWYFYAQPVYPYPNPYVPGEVEVEPALPAVQAVPSYHYYCRNPAGYYPYVPRCLVPWQRVDAGMPPPADAVPAAPQGVPPPGY